MPRPIPAQVCPTTAEPPTDPYQALIAAVIQRAVQDALGHGDLRGTGLPAKVQDDARRWLSGQGAADLLFLAGYEPEPVLRRVRQVLGPP